MPCLEFDVATGDLHVVCKASAESSGFLPSHYLVDSAGQLVVTQAIDRQFPRALEMVQALTPELLEAVKPILKSTNKGLGVGIHCCLCMSLSRLAVFS